MIYNVHYDEFDKDGHHVPLRYPSEERFQQVTAPNAADAIVMAKLLLDQQSRSYSTRREITTVQWVLSKHRCYCGHQG